MNSQKIFQELYQGKLPEIVAAETKAKQDEASEIVGTQRSWEILKRDPVLVKILARMEADVAGALEAVENATNDPLQTDQQVRQLLVRYTTLKRAYIKIVNNEE